MDIEQTLVGVLLHKPECVADIAGTVTEADFKDIRARKALTLAKECYRKQEPFDLVLAGSKMPEHASWLAKAHEVIPINHKAYAEQISNAAKLRRLSRRLKTVLSQKYDHAENMLCDIEKLYRSESGRANRKDGSVGAVLDRVFELIENNRRSGRLHGIDTGFEFLRQHYVQFVPGHMWVITGWTSTGKTTLLIEFLARLEREARCLVISTEMTEEQLVARMIARETGYHNQLILSGKLGERELERVGKVRQEMANREHFIFDDLVEVQEIESLIIRESMRRNVDLVFIDYVQQIRAKGIPRKEWGAEIAERIQQLAKRANTCIVCFSQVSNVVGRGEVDQFEAKGAGEWSACADLGVRLRRDSEKKYSLLLDVQKGRHYGTFQHELQFMADFTRIEEVEYGKQKCIDE